MPNVKDKIQEIVNQLKQLNLQQSILLQQLDQLSEATGEHNTPPTPATTATHAPSTEVPQFVVGDRVRIRNPGILQATSGKVTKLPAKRVTVQGLIGNRISIVVRAPKNIIFE
jgi:transcription antitermination factor NusG